MHPKWLILWAFVVKSSFAEPYSHRPVIARSIHGRQNITNGTFTIVSDTLLQSFGTFSWNPTLGTNKSLLNDIIPIPYMQNVGWWKEYIGHVADLTDKTGPLTLV
jgi:hypothetical protein